MPPAEHIAVLASMILGLAIADLGMSVHRLARATRVNWHWLPILFALIVLISVIQFWWSSIPTWTSTKTIGQFLVPMMQLFLLFLLTAASLPDDVPAEGIDLKAYYFSVHRYAWGLFAAYVLLSTLPKIFQGEIVPINIAGSLAMIALSIWHNLRLHYIIVPILALVPFTFLWRQIAL